MATSEADRLLRIARRDLRMARRLLDPDVEEASWGWALQQAFEKTLKAWLQRLGVKPPHSHDIASDLGKITDPAKLAAENLPEEIPDLVAEILARAVEQRQRRQLSTSFRQREAVLTRVRGRIDHLTTSRRQLLAKGQVACRFEELTIDSPRNRFVRAALETVARLVSQPALAHRCRGLAPHRRRRSPCPA